MVDLSEIMEREVEATARGFSIKFSGGRMNYHSEGLDGDGNCFLYLDGIGPIRCNYNHLEDTLVPLFSDNYEIQVEENVKAVPPITIMVPVLGGMVNLAGAYAEHKDLKNRVR